MKDTQLCTCGFASVFTDGPNVTLTTRATEVMENDELQLLCAAENGNPAVYQYK